jgi:Ca2+-binding EF-hand superfamily protein
MASPSHSALPGGVPEPDLELVPMQEANEVHGSTGEAAEPHASTAAPPSSADSYKVWGAADDATQGGRRIQNRLSRTRTRNVGGTRQGMRAGMASWMKLRVDKAVKGARQRVRASRRERDVQSLENDKKLNPHMYEEEIKSLGSLFDQYADEASDGTLFITQEAVKLMLDEALVFLYQKIDMDRSGHLDMAEVKTLLESLGQRTTNIEMVAVMAELDSDMDGQIDFAEFKRWWDERQYETTENQERELNDLFCAVDTDGSGVIDWNEFLEMIACVPTALPAPLSLRSLLFSLCFLPCRFSSPGSNSSGTS